MIVYRPGVFTESSRAERNLAPMQLRAAARRTAEESTLVKVRRSKMRSRDALPNPSSRMIRLADGKLQRTLKSSDVVLYTVRIPAGWLLGVGRVGIAVWSSFCVGGK